MSCSASPKIILAGCLAAYGLGTLLQFVNRSAYPNLFHGAIPCCVLAVGLLAEMTLPFANATRWVSGLARVAPVAVIVVLAYGFAINPAARQYPSLFNKLTSGPLLPGLFPMKDVRGVSPVRVGFVRAFGKIVKRMVEMKVVGRSVAVLDPADTMFYLESGVPPADRYCPLLPALLTLEQVAEAERRFVDRSFEYLVMRDSVNLNASCVDAYRAFRAIIERDYVLRERIGEFGIWSLRGSDLLRQSDVRLITENEFVGK